MINKKKSILIVYGPGGHREQSKRLLGLKTNDFSIIELTEKNVAPIDNKNMVYKSLPFETKNKISFFKISFSFIYLFFLSLIIFIKHNPKKVITTGPIIGVLPIVVSRFFLKDSVFIESWSRFYEPSITGKILKRFCKKIYIQNVELKKHYPNAIFAGRL